VVIEAATFTTIVNLIDFLANRSTTVGGTFHGMGEVLNRVPEDLVAEIRRQ